MRFECCLIAPVVLALAAPVWAVEEGEDALGGRNLNLLLGADAFYNAGYDGTGVSALNLDGGHVWNGHLSLQHVTSFYQGTDAVAPFTPGEFDFHATETGMILAGRPNASRPDRTDEWTGIAYGADLRSGAFASEWTGAPPTNSWILTYHNVYAALNAPLSDGVDVVNASWHVNGPSLESDVIYAEISSLALAYGKTIVVSAGNDGPAANTLDSPATSNNVIAVGAAAVDANGDFNLVANYSSRGPQDFNHRGTGQVIPGVRADVDIIAPGDVAAAAYKGATGGNRGGVDDPANGQTYVHFQGTSAAAPLVSGAATLLADVGHDRAALYGGVSEATDGRVIRSVLLNSADKITGWDNGQHDVGGGVINTTQSLDWASGAGLLNIGASFDQYTAGTTNLPGSGGGTVQSIGWDFGQVGAANPKTDYFIGQSLSAGHTLDATLSWFSGDIYLDSEDGYAFGYFNNLDLEIWSANAGGTPLALLASSTSLYNPVEHLHYLLPQNGYYLIRAEWIGEVFDQVQSPDTETIGVAWRVTELTAVPEPGSVLLVGSGLMGCAFLRRQKRMRSNG